MSVYYLFYHGLIFIALALSLAALIKGRRRILPLTIVLTLTLAVELTADALYKRGIDFTWLYHLFNICEYALVCWYFLPAIGSMSIRKIVLWSVPAFALAAISISFFFYDFAAFPGININIEGLLLFVLCIYILFTLEPNDDTMIYQLPDFWICIGVLIYFGGTFFYNGIYTNLVTMDEQRAYELFAIINQPLNIALYSSIITGLLCLILKKRSITL